MKIRQKTIIYLMLLIPFLFESCGYTILNKKELNKSNSNVIFGCWISSQSKHSKTSRNGNVINNNFYIESTTMWINDDYKFEIQTLEKYSPRDEHINRITGKFRLNKDTIMISTDGFKYKIEKYIYKVNTDTLWFRPIHISTDPKDSLRYHGFITYPILDYRWNRY